MTSIFNVRFLNEISRPPPTVSFINVLRECFLFEILVPKITKPTVIRENLLNLHLYEKRACKMLLKLPSSANPTYFL
jgi:hypothetical protein